MDAKPTLLTPVTAEEAKLFPVPRLIQATQILRWKADKLQQLWANYYGPEVEWREVPTVPDDAPDDRK